LSDQLDKQPDDSPQQIMQFTQMLAFTDAAVLLLDDQCRVLRSNQAAQLLFDLDKADSDRRLDKIASTLDCANLQDLLNAVLLNGDSITQDVCTQTGQTYSLKVSSTSDADENLTGLVVVLKDATYLRQTEAELKSATAEAGRQGKLFQDFAYAVSHDLQAPLRHLLQFTSILSDEQPEGATPETIYAIENIGTSVERLQSMLTALLDYSRIETQGNSFALVDMNELLSEVVAAFSDRMTHEHATIEVADLPAIVGDRTQLYRLFWHLIDNALKYSLEPPVVRISTGDEELHHLFQIQDNGIGVKERSIEQIFTMFRRLEMKPDVDGRGEGLALCQRIAERHGGLIWCESDGVAGSTIMLRLPTAS